LVLLPFLKQRNSTALWAAKLLQKAIKRKDDLSRFKKACRWFERISQKTMK
jgi:hypothetical protein